jgi:prepilin peptidase CpaA
MADLGQVLSFCATPALCGAAVTDVRSRRVPNLLPALVAAAGLAARAASGDAVPSVLLAGGVFIVLYACWRRGWLGGGDVKLLSACALLVPAGAVAALLLAVALSGGILATVYLVLGAVPFFAASQLTLSPSAFQRVCRVERWRIRRGAPLPYACAICAGCMFTLFAG